VGKNLTQLLIVIGHGRMRESMMMNSLLIFRFHKALMEGCSKRLPQLIILKIILGIKKIINKQNK